MRPILPTIFALVLGLCFTSLCVAGESVDSIRNTCMMEYSPGTYNACTGPLLGTQGSLENCMAANAGDGRGGSIVSVCDQMIRAKCAGVGFDPSKIAGCENFGACASCEAGVNGDLERAAATDGAITPLSRSLRPMRRPVEEPTQQGAQSQQATQPPPQTEVSNDVRSCTDALNQASQCCNRPGSCSQSSSPAQVAAPSPGLSAQCQQMQAAALENARANNASAGVCNARSNTCKTTCSPLVAKYSSLASSSSEYQSALQQIQNAQRSCEGFAAIVKRLGDQAAASASSSGSGFQCSAATTADLSNMLAGSGDGASPDTSSFDQDPAGCATNPNSLACQGMRPPALEATPSVAAFTDDSSKGKPTFNVDPMTGTDAGPVFGSNGQPAGANRANVVANNAGGSIPGGGGGSPASLGAAPKGRGSPGSPGYTTDIMQGDRSGGYTQAATQPGQDDGLNDGRGGSGPAASRGLASVSGMDLKRYLPGGALDPNRRLGGLAGGRQILGRFDDMWKNISNRYTEKCKLGVLVDCQ